MVPLSFSQGGVVCDFSDFSRFTTILYGWCVVFLDTTTLVIPIINFLVDFLVSNLTVRAEGCLCVVLNISVLHVVFARQDRMIRLHMCRHWVLIIMSGAREFLLADGRLYIIKGGRGEARPA